MKRKIITSLLFSLISINFLFLPLICFGATKEFQWTLFLPAMTGEYKICSTEPQTMIWKGLEWQRCDDGHEYIWEMANNYCQSLSLGKHGDWRLPTKDELKSLVVCTNGHPVPLPDYSWCSDGVYSSNFASPTIDSSFQSLATGYWTSSMYSADNFWFVNFEGGNAEIHNIQNGNYVRCVRTP